MNSIHSDLGFGQCFAIDCVGRGSGLALLWIDDFTLSISSFSQSHIDVEIFNMGGGQWGLTGFYGRPEAARRKESWTLLKSLKAASSRPGGDQWQLTGFYLGFALGFAVDWVNMRGGLALIWTNVFRLHQSPVLQSPIAIAIVDPGGCQWRLIGFSGQKQRKGLLLVKSVVFYKGRMPLQSQKGLLFPY
ncbi:hypothetical protein SLEP1_g28177 [Rubroshorea leprosula]|uniref:Uncharacterized protein n=1 Tax=Rubroshorea leprosula TaxID=152421 RepID=A0AAV5JST5_9ROSI|nr:hypothetical protein SLEP1_g28177 [Rubroshorea leprosula]